jgi:hypothetical protein
MEIMYKKQLKYRPIVLGLGEKEESLMLIKIKMFEMFCSDVQFYEISFPILQ